MAPLRLHIDGDRFRDTEEREVILHGINVAGDAKFPAVPNQPSHVAENFFDGDSVSFVGRPFSVEDAHTHFSRLRRWGYTTIRYVFTWEAIEHSGPGKYDDEWISHTISLLRIAKEHGFYVFMDPHQDVWSRFTGGSGAPMWTVYACGLNPKGFAATEAALVQNTYPQPENFPKMIWATNYYRLACQTIFTLFFGGKSFAPNAIIDGKNVQDYLQEHFLGAIRHLARRIHEAGDLEDQVVIGWESFNEPNRGLIGIQDLTVVPKEQKLQKGTSPTAWQAMLTGSGRACEIDTWEFGGLGPYKSGSALIDPRGQSAWLPADYDDTFYGWKRDPDWKLGKCLWAQHGIWDPKTDTLLRPDYFATHPKTGDTIDYEYFTNTFFMDFYRNYSATVRSIHKDAILFCQPPVLEIPPSIKDTKDADPNMVFAPHFYDGITLITKKWNRLWNIDVFGVLRGKYWTPAFAIKVGETAIRNCFRDQLKAIRDEGMEHMGSRPCVFTEIGIPYDMDDKHAYKTGDFSSQVAAMDANHFALEGSLVNGFTLWVYAATNNHYWGDQWNGEDLSIFSQDDRLPPSNPVLVNESTVSLNPESPSFSRGLSSETSTVTPSTLRQTLSAETMTSTGNKVPESDPERAGYRAAEAYIRPAPIAVHGIVTSFGFDLRNCLFTLTLTAPTSTRETAPTEIFLPEWHFPNNGMSVEVTGGKWVVGVIHDQQILRWWHAEGPQKITIRGVKQKLGTIWNSGDDEGYLQQYQQQCSMM